MEVVLIVGTDKERKLDLMRRLRGNNPTSWKRISREDLRSMFDGEWENTQGEGFILKIRNFMLMSALLNHYNVIIDDMRIGAKYRTRMSEIAEANGANFRIINI